MLIIKILYSTFIPSVRFDSSSMNQHPLRHFSGWHLRSFHPSARFYLKCSIGAFIPLFRFVSSSWNRHPLQTPVGFCTDLKANQLDGFCSNVKADHCERHPL